MDQILNWPPDWSTFLLVPALFVGFTVHELAHALVAFLLGDTSQIERNRLSFNPLQHVSWLGMIAFLLFGFGWAKPVMVDQARFRIKNRWFAMFLVSIAGATANLLTALAVLVGISFTVTIAWMVTNTSPVDIVAYLMPTDPGPDLQGIVTSLSYYMMVVNMLLAFFNLLPLPPLDGFQAMLSLLGMVRGFLGRDRAVTPGTAGGSATAEDQESAPTPAQIHFGIGLEYHKAGQLDEAIVRYRQALAHDEQFGLAYYNEGLAYLAKDRRPLAISAFRAALQSAREPGVRLQADLRLHEIRQLEQDPTLTLDQLPPPLEPDTVVDDELPASSRLDPSIQRRVWLRLAIGGGLLLILAVTTWLFVTAATLTAVGG